MDKLPTYEEVAQMFLQSVKYEQVYSVKDVAEYLKISVQSIRDFINRGRIKAVEVPVFPLVANLPDKVKVVTQSELDRFVASRKVIRSNRGKNYP